MNREDVIRFITKGNSDAERFLLDFVAVLHLWDDLIDKDKTPSDEEIHDCFWKALVEIPSNAFYQSHRHILTPIIVTSITNWLTANRLERDGGLPEQRIAYIIRSSYIDVATIVATIIGGRDFAVLAQLQMRKFWHAEGWEGYQENLKIEKEKRCAVTPQVPRQPPTT